VGLHVVFLSLSLSVACLCVFVSLALPHPLSLSLSLSIYLCLCTCAYDNRTHTFTDLTRLQIACVLQQDFTINHESVMEHCAHTLQLMAHELSQSALEAGVK